MKINPNLKILLVLSLIFFAACGLFRKDHGVKPHVTTLDSSAMRQILEAIRSSNQKVKSSPAEDERPYEASATRSWDLINMDLDVEFDYKKAELTGLAKISLKPHAYLQDSLVLDAKGMDIKEISDGDSRGLKILKYHYDQKKLTIFLESKVAPYEKKTVVIHYVAKPNEIQIKGSAAITADMGLYFINNDGKDSLKPRQIWTQGETESNSCWFPTIDKPNQRMTQQISITLEDSNDISLSNGVFVGRMQYKKGVYTDIWRQSVPAAPYLTMMAIGKYYIEHDHWRDKQVNYYVEPKYKPYAKLIFGRTPEMMEFFSKQLGVDFPWEKYSQVVVRDYVSGSMENASATLHGEFLQYDAREYLDDNKEAYISHELFHQWFGDLVTCESWSNVPLNESFATYGECLWLEHSAGKMEADMHINEDLLRYLQEARLKQEPVIRYHYEDKEDMFDNHSYQKGACILNMLRNYLGDEVFFTGLKIYLDKNRLKSVEIHDLRLAMEEVSGEDLNWFFNQWFLRAGHPIVEIKNNYNETEKTQQLSLDFANGPESVSQIFQIPIKVDFYFKDSIHRENIILKDRMNLWTFSFAEKPSLINVDADRVMLWEIEFRKTKDELIYQLMHAPLYLDKKEAMDQLMDKDELTVDEKKSLVDYCLDQKFHGIKALGIEMLDMMRTSDIESYKDHLSQLLFTERNTSFRLSILGLIKVIGKKNDILPVLRACTNDSSYMVMAEALEQLDEKDHQAALNIAQANEQLENSSIVNIITSIYSRDSSADHSAYLVKSVLIASKYEKSIRLSQVNYYIKKAKIEYALPTISGLVKNKYRILKDSTDELLPGIENDLRIKRDILAFELSSGHYIEDVYNEMSKRLKLYETALELLK